MSYSNKISEYNFIKQIKLLPFVDKILLFGSRARGDNEEKSDIDIAVLLNDEDDLKWGIVNAIVECRDTLLKVDLIRFNTLKDGAFKDRILKEQIEL
ncbi:MAG: hypothetical protein Ta2D_05090 [Rickettsiales bacterium]|nr:MAG: hypothetical protein Ta2D_05090 [Rickettsiales bacterium]